MFDEVGDVISVRVVFRLGGGAGWARGWTTRSGGL